VWPAAQSAALVRYSLSRRVRIQWLRGGSRDSLRAGGPKEQACGRARDGDTESAYSDEDSLQAFSRLESRASVVDRQAAEADTGRAKIAFRALAAADTFHRRGRRDLGVSKRWTSTGGSLVDASCLSSLKLPC